MPTPPRKLQDKKARKLTKKRVCISECVYIHDASLIAVVGWFAARNVTSFEAQARGAEHHYPGKQESTLS